MIADRPSRHGCSVPSVALVRLPTISAYRCYGSRSPAGRNGDPLNIASSLANRKLYARRTVSNQFAAELLKEAKLRASYLEPAQETLIECEIADTQHLERVLNEAWQYISGRGMPVVEFVAADDSSMAFARADELVVLLWTDPAGNMRHSLGEPAEDLLVVDYFGSFTELPKSWAIDVTSAFSATRAYFETGSPVVEGLNFVAD